MSSSSFVFVFWSASLIEIDAGDDDDVVAQLRDMGLYIHGDYHFSGALLYHIIRGADGLIGVRTRKRALSGV